MSLDLQRALVQGRAHAKPLIEYSRRCLPCTAWGIMRLEFNPVRRVPSVSRTTRT